MLHLYDRTRETEVHSDASKNGYGRILLQCCPEDYLMHPIYCTSRKISYPERNYPSYELEGLAVVKALEIFRIYFHGISCKIMTACAACEQTMNNVELEPRIAL